MLRVREIARYLKAAISDNTQRAYASDLPTIADALRLLKRRDAYLDGEIVVLTAAGISDFSGLQDALSTHHQRDHLTPLGPSGIAANPK